MRRGGGGVDFPHIAVSLVADNCPKRDERFLCLVELLPSVTSDRKVYKDGGDKGPVVVHSGPHLKSNVEVLAQHLVGSGNRHMTPQSFMWTYAHKSPSSTTGSCGVLWKLCVNGARHTRFQMETGAVWTQTPRERFLPSDA